MTNERYVEKGSNYESDYYTDLNQGVCMYQYTYDYQLTTID